MYNMLMEPPNGPLLNPHLNLFANGNAAQIKSNFKGHFRFK